MFQQYSYVFLHEFTNTESKHIVTKFSHTHGLKDNIFDFVWAAFVFKKKNTKG